MAGFERQVAKYLFTKEVKAITQQKVIENKDSKYSSTHYITPTGQEVGRVMICGALTELEDIGDSDVYYRGRVVDPTGAILIYAGSYQPDSLRTLNTIEPPAHVSVVGKISLYQTEDGTIIPSVRPETVTLVDSDTVRSWTYMAAMNLKSFMNGTNDQESRKVALEKYGDVSEEYKEAAVSALKSLLSNDNEEVDK